jgi:hypothetical protein
VKAYARILPQKPIIISYHVWYSLQAWYLTAHTGISYPTP